MTASPEQFEAEAVGDAKMSNRHSKASAAQDKGGQRARGQHWWYLPLFLVLFSLLLFHADPVPLALGRTHLVNEILGICANYRQLRGCFGSARRYRFRLRMPAKEQLDIRIPEKEMIQVSSAESSRG